MSVTINGTSGVTTPGIANSEGYSGDGLTIAAGAPAGAVTLDASGNLGIGTSSPGNRLHVNGTSIAASSIGINVTNTTTTGFSTVQFGDGTNTTGQIWSGNSSYASFGGAGSLNYSANSGPHAWHINYTERMRLDSSGNLLVGTTSSIARFTVSGNGGTTYCACITQDSGTGNVLGVFGPTNGTTQNLIVFAQASIVKGTISTNGVTVSYNTSSDYRLKENVQPMQNALDKIIALNPVTYNWKADGSADRGFIAHELQEVIPQTVSGEKDAVDAEGNIIPQGVDYGKITPEIVAAIQEQQAMINELKARIEQLEAK